VTLPITPPVLALFGNLDISEVLVIALFAVMIFGRNLPRVAAQVVTQVARARKALQQVWRDSGIGEEIRQVQREIETSARKLKEVDPTRVAGDTMREIEAEVRRPAKTSIEESTEDPDAGRVDEGVEEDAGDADEPAAERNRVPSWYPQTLQPPSSEDFEESSGVPVGQGISPGGLAPRPAAEEGTSPSSDAEPTDEGAPESDAPARDA
jgi:Sec-independent protein translocase protein TatA